MAEPSRLTTTPEAEVPGAATPLTIAGEAVRVSGQHRGHPQRRQHRQMVGGRPQVRLGDPGQPGGDTAAEHLDPLRREDRVDAPSRVVRRVGVLLAPRPDRPAVLEPPGQPPEGAPVGTSLRSPAAIACSTPISSSRSSSVSVWARRSSRCRLRWKLSRPIRVPAIRTTEVAKPLRCSPGVRGSSTSCVRSTVARSEQSSSGPAAVAPPPSTTRSVRAASQAARLRQRKNRGASWTRTRSGAQAVMTRASASRSSRIDRML